MGRRAVIVANHSLRAIFPACDKVSSIRNAKCMPVCWSGRWIVLPRLWTLLLEGGGGANLVVFDADPIFEPEGFNQTFAEMDKRVKNTISHR